MRTKCSREIFTKKCQQQQIFDSDLKGAWHYNHVTFTPIAKKFMLYCRLIYMLPNLCVRLTIKVKVGIPESFKVGWYSPKKTGSSHLKCHRTKRSNRVNYRLKWSLQKTFSSSTPPPAWISRVFAPPFRENFQNPIRRGCVDFFWNNLIVIFDYPGLA